MKILKKFAACVVLMCAFPVASFAEDDSLNPWTECGLGAMIFSSTPWAAAISNVIWDFGTTAVTSAGTSKNTCEGKKVAAARFITDTYANLEEETVKGGGQHVSAVLNIMGCDSASHDGIVDSIRTELGQSMQGATYIQKTIQEKSENYYNIMQDSISVEYSQQCHT